MAKRTRFIEVACAAVLMAGIAGVGFAQTGADAQAKRSAAMKAIGGQLGALRKADATPAERRAVGKTIHDNLMILAANVPAGSGPEDGITTKAKAEIWTDSAGFKAALDSALAASDGLAKASDEGVADAASKIMPTCGGCHSKYRT